MSFVAIDQGTTSTRALALSANGVDEIVAVRQHKQHYPHTGWVEHDPEELLRHIVECLEAVGPITAFGIDNQGESCLAWHAKTGKAISPVLVWQDQRTEAHVARLKAEGHEGLSLSRAGLPLETYFSASKLAWIVANIPEAKTLLAEGNLCLGTTDAFFLSRLTGRHVTDVSTASRTGLLNLKTGAWDEDLCALFGVPIKALPKILPSMGDFGHARINGKMVPVRASVVDQQAALYGHGCREVGDAKITFGTGAFALVISGESPGPSGKGLVPTVAWQQEGGARVFAMEGGVYSAGSALNWAKSLGLFNSFDEINTFDTPPAIERNLAFVPALSGLASPYWDSSAAGLWIGLSLETTPLDMVQAILEGVAFRAAQVVDTMASITPVGPQISIDGGMSTNPYFCQFLADTLQKHVAIHQNHELTALGTMLMAQGEPKSAKTKNPARIYRPQGNQQAHKLTFEKALERARGWAQT